MFLLTLAVVAIWIYQLRGRAAESLPSGCNVSAELLYGIVGAAAYRGPAKMRILVCCWNDRPAIALMSSGRQIPGKR
jgi:hypothetical protein